MPQLPSPDPAYDEPSKLQATEAERARIELHRHLARPWADADLPRPISMWQANSVPQLLSRQRRKSDWYGCWWAWTHVEEHRGRLFYADHHAGGRVLLLDDSSAVASQLSRVTSTHDAVRFARQFGLPYPRDKDGVPSFKDGYPSSTLLHHAKVVRLALEALAAVQADTRADGVPGEQAATFIREVQCERYVDAAGRAWMGLPLPGPGELHVPVDNDPQGLCTSFVATVLDDGLQGVRYRVLEIGERGELAHEAWLADNWVQAVYADLRRITVTGAPTRRCLNENCLAVFQPRDKRMKHCTRQCANAQRQRKSRARRRHGQLRGRKHE